MPDTRITQRITARPEDLIEIKALMEKLRNYGKWAKYPEIAKYAGEPRPGYLAFSKMGRDKGRLFVIISSENGYVTIADGKLRRISQNKKKKLSHIYILPVLFNEILEKMEAGILLQDHEIKSLLSTAKSAIMRCNLCEEGQTRA